MRPSDQSAMLVARARVPRHVVYRAFARETVVLNLETCEYHGLNSSGGRMLEVLGRTSSLRDAARTLAAEYGRSTAELEGDICQFCADLLDRGLIELRGDGR